MLPLDYLLNDSLVSEHYDENPDYFLFLLLAVDCIQIEFRNDFHQNVKTILFIGKPV